MSPQYYDWIEALVTCPECGWRGTGAGATLQEMFEHGAEYGCPRCAHTFPFIAFPDRAQVLADPRASQFDRMQTQLQEDRHARHEQSKLRYPDQLPPLELLPSTLTWDVSDAPGGDSDVVIRAGAVVIWRELSFYENYARFVEIASLLHRKYGAAVRDLAPTPESEIDLYGDRLASADIVDRARAALGRGEDPGRPPGGE